MTEIKKNPGTKVAEVPAKHTIKEAPKATIKTSSNQKSPKEHTQIHT
jgi:DNA-directed RNA polymerase subunit L